jgi:hypothetical protein
LELDNVIESNRMESQLKMDQWIIF